MFVNHGIKMSIRGAQTKTWTKIEMDDFQTIQCPKDFLEQLKISSFIQRIENIQHVMILLLN